MRMRSHNLLAVMLALACSAARAGAQVTPVSQLTDLVTPTSPAFVLLGVDPTSVSRPTSPRAFALDFLSRTENGSVIPRDYAVEFAPYWLSSRPTLTYAQFRQPSFAQLVSQSFAVSVATSTQFEGADTVSWVGLGARTSLANGHQSKQFTTQESKIDSIQALRVGWLHDSITVARQARDPKSATDPARAAVLHDSLATLGAALAQQVLDLTAAAKQLTQLDQQRFGFVAQVAGALAGRYPGNTFDGGSLGRWGLWTTVGYTLEDSHLELLGLARYMDNGAAGPQSVFDVGGRFGLRLKSFAISYEGVARTQVKKLDASAPAGALDFELQASGRQAGIVEYRATPDLYLTGTFGKDFKRASDSKSPLIALLGMKWQFGTKPTLSPD